MKLNKNFERNVNDIVMMGGNKDGIGNITATAEFNFFADPEAAQVVFKRLESLRRVKAKLVTWELCKDSYLPWVSSLKIIQLSKSKKIALSLLLPRKNTTPRFT